MYCDAAKRPVVDQFFQLLHGRVVLQDVADHEDAAVPGCEFDQFRTFSDAERQRLLNKDVFAGLQSPLRHVEMQRGGVARTTPGCSSSERTSA